MDGPKYAIGQQVWVAVVESEPRRTTCPDCRGEKTWKASLPNGEQFLIPCPTCAYGWEGSRGYLADEYAFTPRVVEAVVTGVRFDSTSSNDTTYATDAKPYCCEADVFGDRESATAHAVSSASRAAERLVESNIMARNRKKHDRPGSLVAYLRTEIRRLKRDEQRASEHLARLVAAHPRVKVEPEPAR